MLTYAAVIVRRTSYAYEINGRRVTEENILLDPELEKIKQSWQLVSDILRYRTGGRIQLQTDWYDLPESTLTSLKRGNYKGLFETVHLDPEGIVPFPQELFQMISHKYDGVVFVWDRGEAPKNYGGGRQILPGTPSSQVLKYIGSLTDDPLINLHEFLHGYEKSSPPSLRVHGPGEELPPDFTGQSETDWYLYLIDHYF